MFVCVSVCDFQRYCQNIPYRVYPTLQCMVVPVLSWPHHMFYKTSGSFADLIDVNRL